MQTNRPAGLFQLAEFFISLCNTSKPGIKSMARRFPL
jgi:hypothetical protein